MKIHFYICLIVLSVSFGTGCVPNKKNVKATDLLGTWKTDEVQTEWGTAIIQVTFRDSEEIEFEIKFTDENQRIISQGKYHLTGNQLTSSVINKGKPISLAAEERQLAIEVAPQEIYHFTRQ